MAFLRCLVLAALWCSLLVKSDPTGPVNYRGEQSYPLISAVLDHLNANPNKVFDYDRGSLLSAENKGSIVEVSVEVEVSCNNNYPGIPCNEHALICNAFVGQDSLHPDAYKVLSDVRCSPTTELTMEEPEEPTINTREPIEDQKLELSNEALPPGQESADFVAVRNNERFCPGCPFDLSPDAEGVDELIHSVLKHIESERTQRFKVTNIRRLQQQVVAGIKYVLLADVAQTSCSKDTDLSAVCLLDETVDPIICEVTFIEQPWISTDKHIIRNNCTLSQEFEPVNYSSSPRNDESNEIIPHKDLDNPQPNVVQKPEGHNFDAIAQTGNIEALINPDLLSDIESQILVDTKVQKKHTPHFPTVDEPVPISTNLEDLKVSPLRTLYASMPIEDSTESLPINEEFAKFPLPNEYPEAKYGRPENNWETREEQDQQQFKRDAKPDSKSSESSESKSDSTSSSEEVKRRAEAAQLAQANEDAAKVKRDVEETDESVSDSKDSSEEKKRHRRHTADTSESVSDSKDSSEEKKRPRRYAADVSKSDSDSKDSSEEARRGLLQEIDLRHERVLRDANRDESGESSSSSIESRERIDPIRPKRSIGQLEKILPEEKIIVRDLADFAATSMDNIDDDHHKRVILQILGAKKLKLDGIYYQIILRLGISQCNENEHHENCREKLFTNLTKICKVQVHVEDDYSNPKVVKSQCQNIKKDENDRNRTNYSRYRRQLVGAPEEVLVEDPEVKKIVKDTLAKLDSVSDHPNKHKTIEVVSASKQVVAGIRYLITVKFGLTDCRKSDNRLVETCALLSGSEPETCTIDITEQKWLNKTYFSLKCNDKVYDFGNEEHTRVKRGCVGCPIEMDPLETQKYLKVGLAHLDSTSDGSKRHISEEVLSATSQVVAGRLLRIKARITESNCSKSKANLKDCSKLKDSVSEVCTFSIWEKVWQNFVQVTMKCQDGRRQRKRSMGAIRDDELAVLQKLDDIATLRKGFLDFMTQYNKQYTDPTEFNFRLKVFKDNLNKIALLNKYERGTARYGVTQFADLTEAEFSRRHGYRSDLINENELPFAPAHIPDIQIPDGFDWREKGAVTEVKNQGLCGSCWAFSVTGNVEGQYALKHRSLLEFSEQELVDCDKVDQGCDGGLMDNAYRVIEKLGGLETESDYPYQGADETCIFNKGKVKVEITGAVNISHNETDMAKWLVQNGPISIAINANAMQFYFGGISHPWASLCSPNSLDHGVLIVGYGVHSYALFNRTIPYWIIKNSWGPSWGEQGYYRVFRGDGTCGLNQTPSSAIVA